MCLHLVGIPLFKSVCYFRFGLYFVGTTNRATSSTRQPLKDVDKNYRIKNMLPLKKLNTVSCNKNSKFTESNTASTSLAHEKKGYDGMGGQSKVLILPKRTFTKPSTSKIGTRKITIPRPKNNMNLKKFLSNTPRLPQMSP